MVPRPAVTVRGCGCSPLFAGISHAKNVDLAARRLNTGPTQPRRLCSPAAVEGCSPAAAAALKVELPSSAAQQIAATLSRKAKAPPNLESQRADFQPRLSPSLSLSFRLSPLASRRPCRGTLFFSQPCWEFRKVSFALQVGGAALLKSAHELSRCQPVAHERKAGCWDHCKEAASVLYDRGSVGL